MGNKKNIIILIAILLVFIVLGAITLVVINKEKIDGSNNGTNIGENTKLVDEVEYIEIAIEDEEAMELEYKDLIRIEDAEAMKNLIKMINTGKEHEFNGAFGFEIPPYAILHLKNGDEMMVSAIDELEMEGEEPGNYIIVMVNNNDEEKKTYKVDGKIETEIIRIYKEEEKSKNTDEKNSKKDVVEPTSANDNDYFVLYKGYEIKKETGLQYATDMEISKENENKYNITYYNYEKGKYIGEKKGTFGEETYEGVSLVDKVSKIAMSKKFDAIPRKYTVVDSIPQQLKEEMKEYSSVSINSIDLDGDNTKEYIICCTIDLQENDTEDGEPKAFSKIMLYDNTYKKIADLVKLEDGFWAGIKDEANKILLSLDRVEYIDIDNDGIMEIIVEVPTYEGTELSIVRYKNKKIDGKIDFEASVLP